MSALEKFIYSQNLIADLFGDAHLDANNLSQAEINKLLEQVDSSLSPENLTCDGELSRAEVVTKGAYLLQVHQELLDLKV